MITTLESQKVSSISVTAASTHQQHQQSESQKVRKSVSEEVRNSAVLPTILMSYFLYLVAFHRMC